MDFIKLLLLVAATLAQNGKNYIENGIRFLRNSEQSVFLIDSSASSLHAREIEYMIR
jgi:hypothetical protein